eukprot:4843989-Pyramimonas_sp.AAC.1
MPPPVTSRTCCCTAAGAAACEREREGQLRRTVSRARWFAARGNEPLSSPLVAVGTRGDVSEIIPCRPPPLPCLLQGGPRWGN